MMVTKALVLGHADWRDYDRMVTLLSPDQGKIDAVARGCRKPKSILMNCAELFTAGEFTLLEAHGRFTITQCQISESFYPLRTDFGRLTAGVYFLHLLRQNALPGQACEALFVMALKALALLAYGELPPALVTLAFELHLMNLTGQAPCVDQCVLCARPFEGERALLADGQANIAVGAARGVGRDGLLAGVNARAACEKLRFDARLGGAVCAQCARGGQPLSNGARRILLRVPKTRIDVADKLLTRPEWPEAARHARRFVEYRIDTPPKIWPPLPETP
ncbi:MAG: DNA repair protein RecO [Clostridia bacterium]